MNYPFHDILIRLNLLAAWHGHGMVVMTHVLSGDNWGTNRRYQMKSAHKRKCPSEFVPTIDFQ